MILKFKGEKGLVRIGDRALVPGEVVEGVPDDVMIELAQRGDFELANEAPTEAPSKQPKSEPKKPADAED
jgi:hypothetical protein